MRIRKISISGFRNLKQINIQPGSHFNLIYGLNGQGKTNFLESLYILGNPRSFRQVRSQDMIAHEETRSIVNGHVETGHVDNKIKLLIENSGRKVELNGKHIKKASELHGVLNTIVFSPDDTYMIKGTPETRRRYLDRVVYTGDIGYLFCWHAYSRILKQRNALLKNSDKSGLDTWTEKLAETGAEVIKRRLRYVEKLNKILSRQYRTISGKEYEIAEIAYKPEGISKDDISEIRMELLELISRNRNKDEKYGTTSIGPHRDDLIFNLNGCSLKSFGSQGQHKSFVLALKMAEIDHLASVFDEPPVFLIDDFSSELDIERKSNLIEFLKKRDLQTFITTTDHTDICFEDNENCAVFHVEHGNLTFKG